MSGRVLRLWLDRNTCRAGQTTPMLIRYWSLTEWTDAANCSPTGRGQRGPPAVPGPHLRPGERGRLLRPRHQGRPGRHGGLQPLAGRVATLVVCPHLCRSVGVTAPRTAATAAPVSRLCRRCSPSSLSWSPLSPSLCSGRPGRRHALASFKLICSSVLPLWPPVLARC